MRDQLVQIESALATIRQDVLPVNADMFDLMAEGYVEQTLKLRAEIDEYLRIDADLAGSIACRSASDVYTGGVGCRPSSISVS